MSVNQSGYTLEEVREAAKDLKGLKQFSVKRLEKQLKENRAYARLGKEIYSSESYQVSA